ncbi:hypothetical protein PS847_00957 [Pseudomonas fluorescens]|uniref:Uncharacterized protein n=1 Tax=Pseudomonas fluorescens TaxID=294 RepID=A0A5E7HJE1_PSEFL|nr:hypothetical protein PS847_00957 [Pseudomonas fluorescens]
MSKGRVTHLGRCEFRLCYLTPLGGRSDCTSRARIIHRVETEKSDSGCSGIERTIQEEVYG